MQIKLAAQTITIVATVSPIRPNNFVKKSLQLSETARAINPAIGIITGHPSKRMKNATTNAHNAPIPYTAPFTESNECENKDWLKKIEVVINNK
jgi:hypothetical protein